MPTEAMPVAYGLDKGTTLTAVGARSYEVDLDRTFWNHTSAFGGWVAALTVAACETDDACRGELVSQDIQFISAIRAERLRLDVTLVEQRRSMDFWRVTVHDAAVNGRIVASASLIAGERRATDLRFDRQPDAVRGQAESFRLERRPNSPSWFDHYEIFLAQGRPFRVNESLRSTIYLREADGRPLDSKGISAIVDTPMPRSFFLSESMLFASTISLSTHIYATREEIAAVGDGFVRLDSDGRAVRDSLINQESALYREDGLLLATSYQTGIFRES